MAGETDQITHRIRELREIMELSQETLATKLGLTVDKYREYESGEADFPAGLLHEIARRFNVQMTSLLTGEEPRLHTYCLVRKGEGVGVQRRQEYDYQSLALNFVNKQAEPFLVTVEPDEPSTGVSFNVHPGQEFNYVLEGRLQVIIDDHELELSPGDSLYFDAGYPHGMRALGGTRTRFLAIVV